MGSVTVESDTAAGYDPFRAEWRVSTGPYSENRVFVTGRMTSNSAAGVITFEAADGSVTRFGPGEWLSIVGLPHPDNPTREAALGRAFLRGQATLSDMRSPWGWYDLFWDEGEGQ